VWDVFEISNEPMLNTEYFNPFIKKWDIQDDKHNVKKHHYNEIYDQFESVSDEVKSLFIKALIQQVRDVKKYVLIENLQEEEAKIIPLCLFIKNLFSNHRFKDNHNVDQSKESQLRELAHEVHELRMTSAPNGTVA
jgi:hypothetical protein